MVRLTKHLIFSCSWKEEAISMQNLPWKLCYTLLLVANWPIKCGLRYNAYGNAILPVKKIAQNSSGTVPSNITHHLNISN